MAVDEKILNIGWKQQQATNYCGPAVAEMFLSFFGVSLTQAQLWTAIQANSTGTGAGPITFATQVCDNCGSTWECWDTTPEALEATSEASAPAPVALQAEYPATFNAGVQRLIESLDATPEVPAFATIYTINHWVLVHGYRRDDLKSTNAPPTMIGPYNLNGIYILDPQQTDPVERIRLVSMVSVPSGPASWGAQFGLLVCGPKVDTYPIVVSGGARSGSGPVPPPPVAPRGLRIVREWAWYLVIGTLSMAVALMLYRMFSG